MITYITADTHLAKESTNTLNRPFADAREMSEHVIDRINSRAQRNDRLIIIGDFSFKEPSYWRQRLVCKNTMLIIGNHNRFTQSIDAFEEEEYYKRNVFAFGNRNVRQQYDSKLCDWPTFFSHYPTLYWPKSHYGSMHCFGHVHDQRTDTIETAFPDIRAMDAGLDAAKRVLGDYTCFSDREIYDILMSRAGHDDVNFYKELRGKYNKDH